MREERVILGENCSYSANCDETGLNNNVLVCGGSGSGKTMSIGEPRLLQTKYTNLIATVAKRRIVEKYIPLFKKRKYRVLDLNLADPLKSTCAFDPMQYITDNSDITFLAKAIVKADPQKEESTSADPYWDQAAISLLSAEIAYTRTIQKNATFADVLELHDMLTIEGGYDQISTSLDGLFGELDKNSFAVTCWKSFKCLPARTAGCVYGTLNAAIDTMFPSELRQMITKKPKIDFEQFTRRKTVLFVTTSAVNPALHSFVNLFYAQAFKKLFEYAEKCPEGMLPIPVHMLCDDFACGGRVLNFPEYISIFREKGISVTLLLQSESQLEQMYGPGNTTTIINNCDTYVFLGGMDLRTARNISVRLDAPLDEVLYMPIGQEIIFRRGQRPIQTTRYDVRSDEQYQEVTGRYKSKDTDDLSLPDDRETSEDERVGDDRIVSGRSGGKTLRSHIRKSV